MSPDKFNIYQVIDSFHTKILQNNSISRIRIPYLDEAITQDIGLSHDKRFVRLRTKWHKYY